MIKAVRPTGSKSASRLPSVVAPGQCPACRGVDRDQKSKGLRACFTVTLGTVCV